jgi:phospholipase C
MKPALPLALACLLTACSTSSGSTGTPAVPGVAQARHGTSPNPIQHVVFIIQENRSFNNLFLGYPGAATQNYGYDTNGDKISLQPTHLATGWDIDHSSTSFFEDCDGTGSLPGTDCKVDGWNNELAGLGAPKNFAYEYVMRGDIRPYWDMAKQYVLADNAFQSNLDGSFIAHQYAVAAYASRAVDAPDSAWGCEGGKADTIPRLTAQRTMGSRIPVCFNNPSIASEADAASVSWRYYAVNTTSDDGGIWSAYQADKPIYRGPDWNADVINPPSQFLTDVAAGTLANVTWITPTNETSDHPGLNASQGPAWVASVVNAVGESKFWDSTAIFVLWDDWGGWFDPVPPVFEDYDGLGFRVPMIVISPYAKRGYVTHVQYETASVVRYIEDTFGLGRLAAADARAADPTGDALDYSQKPRAFKPIPGSKPAWYWVRIGRRASKQGKPAGMLGDD